MSAPEYASREAVQLFSPAKINLMLSVHGPREDGFHELTSLVVALDFGDDLSVGLEKDGDRLADSSGQMPLGRDNLILQAAERFRKRLGEERYFSFAVVKRIPMGAGLGGGSSNAATALVGMNQLCGDPLGEKELVELAAEIGSDCPFFIDPRPSIMRGRGEVIEPLPESKAASLVGLRLLIFRPHFGVSTPWAYNQLRESGPAAYEPVRTAEERLERLLQEGPSGENLFNSFESVVAGKFFAIPALLDTFRNQGFSCLLSGSGSACFCLMPMGGKGSGEVENVVAEAWGSEAFKVETRIRGYNNSSYSRSFHCQHPLLSHIIPPVSEDQLTDEVILQGVAASPGVAHGNAFLYLQKQLDVPCYLIPETDIENEMERFDQAILQTRREISEVRNKVAESLGEGEALIFDAHLMVLEDNALIDEVHSELKSKMQNIECSFNAVIERYIKFFSTVEDEYLRERVSDIRDVSRRLLHNLTGQKKTSIGSLAGSNIIVSEDISPSDAASLGQENLMGFVTDSGGKTSHSVIMARSLGIPAVVGLHDATKKIKSGQTILIDGYDGLVVVNPTTRRLYRYGKLISERQKLEKVYLSSLTEPSETADGTKVEIMANIEGAREMDQVIGMRADGVGLFRTEGIFLRQRDYPSEDVQFEEYAAAAKAAKCGAPVIIRTLDIGGDKTLGTGSPMDDNSFLGFRAIRFCLENLDVFKPQLRAILRASAFGNVKMMYPMISGLGELRRANDILESVKAELREEGKVFNEEMEVGAMIEVPSAVTVIDLLAREVDFFSIGTNDLIQYLMAVDRLNDLVSHLYEPTHPAVIRTLKQIMDGAKAAGKPIGVCGELAGDPLFASLLIGLGTDSLSLSANMIPELKYFIRRLDASKARKMVGELMKMDDANTIRQRLVEFHEDLRGEAIRA